MPGDGGFSGAREGQGRVPDGLDPDRGACGVLCGVAAGNVCQARDRCDDLARVRVGRHGDEGGAGSAQFGVADIAAVLAARMRAEVPVGIWFRLR